ncbi:MAG: hypothetical protein N2Z63_08570 [Thiobacillaceae bacterium]|nr:hypothetical protein [Thiobacillaceae bacterium]
MRPAVAQGGRLLAVVEFLAHARLKSIYEDLGYAVTQEFTVRRAIAQLRRTPFDVIAADFYFQPDFRDRVSNLESLLAAAQPHAGTRVLVYHDPAHAEALTKVRARFRIDAALTMPVDEAALSALLQGWR